MPLREGSTSGDSAFQLSEPARSAYAMGLTRSSASTGNRLLDALPAEIATRCLARCERRTHSPGVLIAHRGDNIEEVYFPIRGAVSEIEEGLDGGSDEVTAIGPEGICGVEALWTLRCALSYGLSK